MGPPSLLIALLCTGALLALGFLRFPLTGRLALLLTGVPVVGFGLAIAFC